MNRLKVYGASKIEAYSFWRDMRHCFPEVHWTAHWPDKCLVATTGIDQKPNPQQSQRAWLIDFMDIQRADACFVLAPFTAEGKLRGALVEAGYALALGKPVCLIGDCPDFGSWQYHPLVTKFCLETASRSIEAAITYLTEIGQ